MRRREFIGLLGGTAVTWPLAARTQQPTMPVVGWLSSGSRESENYRVIPFQEGLKEALYSGPERGDRIPLGRGPQ
jgi:putative tryptophan/tyrosine transport system substrate-binding protein